MLCVVLVIKPWVPTISNYKLEESNLTTILFLSPFIRSQGRDRSWLLVSGYISWHVRKVATQIMLSLGGDSTESLCSVSAMYSLLLTVTGIHILSPFLISSGLVLPPPGPLLSI